VAASTIVRFSDLDNQLAAIGGEFFMARGALESPQVGVTWIRLPEGASTQGEKGHLHDEQDEVYVVVSGGPVEFKIENQAFELAPGEAIKIVAPSVHGLRNVGSEALVIAISGQLPLGGDDSHPVDGFWS
jgi:quercetin dioxygenase-like cupin family protein